MGVTVVTDYGPGDFLHPDETYTFSCDECSGYEECEDDCLCDKCIPFRCNWCREEMCEYDYRNGLATVNGDVLCEPCHKEYRYEMTVQSMLESDYPKAKDWDDGSADI